MSIIPINIAFKLPKPLLQQVKSIQIELNEQQKGQDYFLKGIPHLTLWMGFVDSKDLTTIKRNLFYLDLNNKFSALNAELTLFKKTILSINISRTATLSLFQSKIQNVMETFRRECDTSQNLNQNTLEYLNSVNRRNSIHFDPHITVGFADAIPNVEFKKFYLTDIQIFEVRNNGTCTTLKL